MSVPIVADICHLFFAAIFLPGHCHGSRTKVGSKMKSKIIQSNDNFESLRVLGFKTSASPSISKEMDALLRL